MNKSKLEIFTCQLLIFEVFDGKLKAVQCDGSSTRQAEGTHQPVLLTLTQLEERFLVMRCSQFHESEEQQLTMMMIFGFEQEYFWNPETNSFAPNSAGSIYCL